ncbi:hypothetical protein ACFQO7_22005 [Catellatospora aurea]|uniref:2TM domain-containing protein n=1 Tax=Catellatospora aurea TaxID=1337874 RepID=A0ABW2GYZ4_9ACTN
MRNVDDLSPTEVLAMRAEASATRYHATIVVAAFVLVATVLTWLFAAPYWLTGGLAGLFVAAHLGARIGYYQQKEDVTRLLDATGPDASGDAGQ